MQLKFDYMLGRSQKLNTTQLILFSKKVCTFLEREFLLVIKVATVYQNHAIREIKCEYDPCMFVVTNNRQGLDVLKLDKHLRF